MFSGHLKLPDSKTNWQTRKKSCDTSGNKIQRTWNLTFYLNATAGFQRHVFKTHPVWIGVPTLANYPSNKHGQPQFLDMGHKSTRICPVSWCRTFKYRCKHIDINIHKHTMDKSIPVPIESYPARPMTLQGSQKKKKTTKPLLLIRGRVAGGAHLAENHEERTWNASHK